MIRQVQPNPPCSRPSGAGMVSVAKIALEGSRLQYSGLKIPAGSANEIVMR